MGKEAEFLFTVTVGIPFWGLGEHEPIIISLFLPVFFHRNWRGTWTVKNSYWEYLTTRAADLECKREWEKPGTVHIEGKLRQVSEEASEKSGDMIRIFLHWEWAVPSMSDDVVRRLLRIVS